MRVVWAKLGGDSRATTPQPSVVTPVYLKPELGINGGHPAPQHFPTNRAHPLKVGAHGPCADVGGDPRLRGCGAHSKTACMANTSQKQRLRTEGVGPMHLGAPGTDRVHA
jgi:hypothetical protein